MKTLFEGYYDPTEADIRALWADALIVLDTNVLLNLYRVPEKARNEILNLLLSQRERLWIPYQVAAEFHRNRLKALKDEYDKARSLATTVNKAHATFRQTIQSIQFPERGSSAEADPVMNKIAEGVTELSKLADGLAEGYVSPSKVDPVAEFLTTLLEGRVGSRPDSQQALDALYREAAERYSVGTGPGHLDQSKAGDKYMTDGLIYDRQYGDYVLWSQLLAHCQQTKPAGVLLITSDVKEDWWQDTKSISGLRPQPELVMDIGRRGGVPKFWMYTLVDFVKHSQKYLHSKVSEGTITDVEQVDHIFPRAYGGNMLVLSREQHRTAAAPKFDRPLYGVVGAIGKVIGADSYRLIGESTVIATLPMTATAYARDYAIVDVTNWPKDPPSLAGLDEYVSIALATADQAPGLILYDAVLPPEFWSSSRWVMALAFRLAEGSIYAVDVLGASSVNGEIVLVPVFDERPASSPR